MKNHESFRANNRGPMRLPKAYPDDHPCMFPRLRRFPEKVLTCSSSIPRHAEMRWSTTTMAARQWPLRLRTKSRPLPSHVALPEAAPQDTPEARPAPILRRLSSPSEGRAAPRYAVLRTTRAGCRGRRRAGQGRVGVQGCGQRGGQSACRVGRAVAHPGPSPDPDKEISTIRLFRRIWLVATPQIGPTIRGRGRGNRCSRTP